MVNMNINIECDKETCSICQYIKSNGIQDGYCNLFFCDLNFDYHEYDFKRCSMCLQLHKVPDKRLRKLPIKNEKKKPMKKFKISIISECVLDTLTLWPDGDAPKNPTIKDVSKLVKEWDRYPGTIINAWNLPCKIKIKEEK